MINVKLQAHRGVSTDFPENTMSAFRGAVEQGYEYIELDPAVTADGMIAVLHDSTINRTGRNADGSVVAEKVSISDITYAQALGYDYGIWFGDEFKDEKIPLLSEVFDYLKDKNVVVKIDNKMWRFPEERIIDIFSLAKEYGVKTGITCGTLESVYKTLEYFPEAEIHYDGAVSDEVLSELSRRIEKERLTVWMPYKCELTSWVTTAFADEEICAKIKKCAKLGIWILSDYDQAQIAVDKFGADIIETTGSIKHKKKGN